MANGYPTPDVPETQTYRCVSIIIPDSVGDVFYSVLLGQITELTRDYYWMQQGTMTPEQAASVWNSALVQNDADGEDCMSCEDVADCIEDSETVKTALEKTVRELGFSSDGTDNPSTPPIAPIGGGRMEGDMLPVGFDCEQAPNSMSIARNIVQSINTYITDWLEVIELVTNPAELAAIMSDNVEGLSYVAGTALEIGAWVQDVIGEFYAASYTESAEDEIACEIFCHITENCQLTYQDVIDIYADIAGELIPDQDDIYAMMEFFITLGATIDTTTVAIVHLFVLHMMRWGKAFGWSGIGSFETDIRAWSKSDDWTYEDCDCAPEQDPTSTWALYTNLQSSLGGYTVTIGDYTYGKGVAGVNSSGNARVQVRLADLGAAYTLRQFCVVNQRQATGGTPSGTDTDNSATWVAANFSGTALQNGTFAFKNRSTNASITTWTGDLPSQRRSLQFDSVLWQLSTVRAFYMRRVGVWGYAGVSDTKPDGAIWVDDLSTDDFLAGL